MSVVILLTQGSWENYGVVNLVEVPSRAAEAWVDAKADCSAHAKELGSHHAQPRVCCDAGRLLFEAERRESDALHLQCREMLARNPAHRKGFRKVDYAEVWRDA